MTPTDCLYHYSCRVVRVIDGDTVEAVLSLGLYLTARHRLRLLGVNCPECRGETREAGRAATEFTYRWIANAQAGMSPGDFPLVVRTVKTDDFGRYLGAIYRADTGESLSAALLDAGHAVPFMVEGE